MNWAAEQEPRRRSSFAVGSLDGMVSLYHQINIHDHDWRTLGPERDEIEWEYFSFDGPDIDELHRRPSMALMDSQHRSHNEADRQLGFLDRATGTFATAEERAAAAKAAFDESQSDRDRQRLDQANANLEQAREAIERARKNVEAAVEIRDHQMLAGHLPKGLEAWFAPEFNASQAGWKRGKAPFANTDGEAKPVEWRCRGN